MNTNEIAAKQPNKTGERPHSLHCSRWSKKNIFFFIIELLLLVFLVFYICMLFLENTTKDVSINTIQKVMEQNDTVANLVEGDANTLKRTFSLEAGTYDSALVYTSDSLMDVSELLIVKTEDAEQLTAIENAVTHHLEEQKQKFNGYGTDQYSLLEHAIITVKGNYLFYGISNQADRWEEAFLSCIK